MKVEEKQQIETKVEQLNAKLTELGIHQLSFNFEVEDEVVQLLYKLNSCNFSDWVGSIVDSTSSEILAWLKVQETQFYLYKQLVSYFKGAFARLIKLDDGSLGLTSNGLTYQFGYITGQLLVVCSKNYEKDLLELGTKLGEMKLEKVIVPKEKHLMWTKCILGRVIQETDLLETLDFINSEFENFEGMFVNQTTRITDK